MTKSILRLLTLLLAVIPTAASAHPGIHDGGFADGLSHPFSGIDHVMVMVAVGLFAAHLGGRALWLLPVSFLSAMAIGGALGIAGVQLPFVEFAIGLSVVVLGLALALQINPPVLAAMGLVGLFAIFHGHAHGSEMNGTASGVAYGLGFIIATASLHAIGIGFGLGISVIGNALSRRIVQAGGGAMALAGVALLAGII